MDEPLETIADALAMLSERQPAAPAIHVPGRAPLTYGDLGAQIRYVRDRLGNWGIRAGDIVCAALSSRPELAVAIATLPASCAFAPVDPSLPGDAYVALLLRMKARAILVASGDAHPLRFAARRLGIAEIELTSERDAAAGMFTLALGRSDAVPAVAPSVDPGVAYVLASSGTTGRRKLVPFEHRALLRYARAMADWLEFNAGDLGVHIMPLHLGNGLCANVVSPLVAGHATVCLPEADIVGFYESIEAFRPTFLIAGFAQFRAILRRAPEFSSAVAPNRLRFLRAGSGRLDPDDVDRLEQLFGAPMLVGLSSSETLQIAHDPLPPRRRKRGSVGLPVVNEVATLSDSGELEPRGGCGEIVVRGPLVFRGYLDDPALTAASFTDSWFHTGDLGRIDEDGYVHVTGRIKEIINRGGEKISPVEIDLAIESLPGVKDAATFGVPHPSLGEEVVAAVVREGNATIDEARVMEQVRAHAGVRKAPRRVYFVDHLPRTRGGKLRRNALAEWLSPGQDFTAPDGGIAMARPASPSALEDELAQLWSSLLQTRAIGRDDDFFLLGGDSLLGIELIAHLKERFGIDLPIESLFGKAATVAGMARIIAAMSAGEAEATRQSAAGRTHPVDAGIRPRGGHEPLPLSHTQARMWFMERLDEGSRAYNLASAYRLTGAVDVAALRESLLAIVERHEILRTTFVLVDHEPRQIVHPTARLDFQCLDLAPAQEADGERALLELIELERQLPFPFDTAPLARLRLIRLANGDHVLLQVWHHIVADGWSAEVFESELSREYEARVNGEVPAIAAPTVQYADYALWQRAWLAGAEGERQLGFWREALGDLGTLDLATDRPRPTVQSYRGRRLVVPLRAELVARIAALSRDERATLFMTWLAAFQVLLHRYTGQEDIAVGTQVAGRPRAELEGLIGFFVNTLVLRSEPRRRAELPRAAARESASARWAPTRTRTCRSRGWSRSCSRVAI